MINRLRNSKIGIIGGGILCRHLIELLYISEHINPIPNLLGIADSDPDTDCCHFARELGISTTTDYNKLCSHDEVELIIDTTDNHLLSERIKKVIPHGVDFLDHYEARTIVDYLRIEREKKNVLKKIESNVLDNRALGGEFEKFWQYILSIAEQRNTDSKKIRNDLMASERAMAQIVQGSTIPTFVINSNHMVTHWNKACEVLTGYKADEIVGTDQHWKPFREQARPIMADLILDGVDEEKVWHYYGTKWKKSSLIDGAYEAEEYFSNLGDNGKWLFFTAAPIRVNDGRIVGAIETLWDRTEDKKAEEERECHTQELAESERAMAQIIQGSTVATFVVNQDHIVTHWNKALENLSGYLSGEMVGTRRQWLPFWDNERPAMADVVLDQLDEGEIQNLYRNWRKSPLIEGAYEAEEFFPKLGLNGKWCFFTAAPIISPQGDIIGAVETLWDRTEYKKAEEERERHYTELAGLCSIYTALNTSLDLDLRLKAAVGEISNILAADSICIFLRQEDSSFRLEVNHGPGDSSRRKFESADSRSIIHRIAEKNEVIIFENLSESDNVDIGLDRREGLKSLAYVPVSSKENDVLGIIRIGSRHPNHFSIEGKNILELIGNRIGVAIENSLLHSRYIKSEKKYRSLFDNDPNPIFIISTNSLKILDINKRARDCYQYTRSEFLDMTFLNLGHETDVELKKRLDTISGDQSILFTKKKHRRRNGQSFYVNINVSRTSSGDKDVFIATTTDISETVEKETQLIQASKMTTLGQMAAGIAHEINQPLNVIQVCSDYFLKMINKGHDIGEKDLRTLIDDINSNVQRATGIIRHMRDFARQSEVIRNRININEPIRDVFKVLGHQVKAHRVELTMDLDPDIAPILAEHNRLEQVFINLVTNAIDAMDERSRTETLPEWQKRLSIKSYMENHQVIVTVKDNGIGMTRETMDKIFEPFFTTKEVGKGTGLGVSISYGIIKDYDGKIEITSEPGKGTCFGLRFPAIEI
ncbi:MAG: PAS domain S-box protein [Desulfobacteraceae bacterium]|nr:PAS domain S-box protein [Desulfobacteraceae bacterium]